MTWNEAMATFWIVASVASGVFLIYTMTQGWWAHKRVMKAEREYREALERATAHPRMSESMIERVAKAIYDRGSVLGKSWDDTEQGHRDFYRDLARAAIEAMRTPTNCEGIPMDDKRRMN